MKLLVDMNLSPDWVVVLKEAGWEANHWSKIGNPRAVDSEIMAWAKKYTTTWSLHTIWISVRCWR